MNSSEVHSLTLKVGVERAESLVSLRKDLDASVKAFLSAEKAQESFAKQASLTAKQVAAASASNIKAAQTESVSIVKAQHEIIGALAKRAAAMRASDVKAQNLINMMTPQRRVSQAPIMDAANTQKMSRGFLDVARSASTARVSIANLHTAFIALGVGALVNNIVHAADSFARLQARLTMVNGDAQATAAQLSAVMTVSNRLGTSFEADASFYTKLAQATKQYNLSGKELVNIQEALSTSFILSGADSIEAAQGIRQLGQAFSKGKLDGDEFRTVMETNLVLKQKLEEKFGSGAALWKASEEGLLQIKDVIGVLRDNLDEFQRDFDKMPRTIAQGMQRVKNDIYQIFSGTSTGGLESALQQMHITLTDPEVQQGIQNLAGGMVKLTEWTVKAASGISKVGVGLAQFAIQKDIEAQEKYVQALEKERKAKEFLGASTVEIDKKIQAAKITLQASTDAMDEAGKETQELTGNVLKLDESIRALHDADLAKFANVMSESMMQANAQLDTYIKKAEIAAKAATLDGGQLAVFNLQQTDEYKKASLEAQKIAERDILLIAEKSRLFEQSQKGEEVLADRVADAEKKAREEIEQTNKAYQDRVESLLGGTYTGQLEKLQADQALLNELMNQGGVTAVKASEALKTNAEAIEKIMKEINKSPFDVAPEDGENSILAAFDKDADRSAKMLDEAFSHAFNSINDAMADFLFDPFAEGTEGMLRSFGVMIQKMIAQAAAAQLMQAMFGQPSDMMQGGWVGAGLSLLDMGGPGVSNSGLSIPAGSTFDLGAIPMFDKGGYIPFGGIGIAGERGPELITGPANITSRKDTAKMMGGITSSVVINVSGANASQDIYTAASAASKQINRSLQGAQRYA